MGASWANAAVAAAALAALSTSSWVRRCSGASATTASSSTASGLRISSDVLARSSETLLGLGVEDVNHELYGGIYSQMVYGEDFEEPAGLSGVSGDDDPGGGPAVAGSSPTWAPLLRDGNGGGGELPPPAFEVVASDVFNGRQSQLLLPGGGPPAEAAVLNRGLYRQGMHVSAGEAYEGYLFARAVQAGDGVPAPSLRVSLVASTCGASELGRRPSCWRAQALQALGTSNFTVGSRSWQRFDFTLRVSGGSTCYTLKASSGACRTTPEGECVLCSGGLVVAAAGGPVVVDFVFLQPGAWGRFGGLPVRLDAARALQAIGVQALRLGGSTCNVPGWRWKNMRGPREHRQPYRGEWHPFASQGWRIFEFLDLCEALGLQAVVTLNNEETPEDLADLVEYAHGDAAATAWGRLRARDGRSRPYAPFVVEIGNEQALDYQLIRQVSEGAEAMRLRAGVVGLDPRALRFAIGHNLDMAVMNTPVCDAMVNATKFLGDSVLWDLHVDGDEPEQEDHWEAAFHMALAMLDRLGSRMKLAVFEENAFRHDLVRGLNRARYANAFARLGGRFSIGTAANGLQVGTRAPSSCRRTQPGCRPSASWIRSSPRTQSQWS